MNTKHKLAILFIAFLLVVAGAVLRVEFTDNGGAKTSAGVLAMEGTTDTGKITRGPYLQPTEDMLYKDLNGDFKASVGVAWRTVDGGTATIYYGINSENENSLNVNPQQATEVGETVYKYYIKLTDLIPGTFYKYQVVVDGDATPVYQFKTSPADGRFKLIVGSDWHFGNADTATIEQRFLKIYPDMLAFNPDILFLPGDIVGTDNYLNNLNIPYEEAFKYAKELFATAILILVPGNHELAKDPKLDFFVEQFYFPENGPSNQKERVYSFDYGRVHFVSMMPYPDSAWLEQDFKSAKSREVNFIFTSHHLPTYADNYHDMWFTVDSRTTPVGVYDKYPVDIEFVGHNHVYQRSLPMAANNFDLSQMGIIFTPEKEYYNAQTKGTIYQTSRSLHYPIIPAYNNLYIASRQTEDELGYTEIVIDSKKATVDSYGYYTYGPTGTRRLADHYIIDKNDTSEKPTPAISGINTKEVGAYRAVIEWQTDIPLIGQVEFGTSSGNYSYVDMREDQNQVFTTSHRAILQALTPGTIYYYRVKSWRAGKESVSGEYSFTTNVSAQTGELVAEFDFGPNAFAPDGVRVSPLNAPYCHKCSSQIYDSRIRQGTFYPEFPFETNASANLVRKDATDTFLARSNANPPLRWWTELPNGDYDVEVTVGKGGWYFGDTRIVLKNGQVNFEAATPEDTTNTVWVWPASVSINDGFLDITLGYGNGNYSQFTIINRVKVWAKGHLSPDDVVPVANAGADQKVDVGTEVNFDGSGSTDNIGIVYYYWDFDASDGIQIDASGLTAKHTYNNSGTYTVTLTINDAAQNGPVSDTLTVNVVSGSVAPTTKAMPAGRTYSTPITVTLLSNKPATVYYSSDGGDPQIGAPNTKSGASPLSGIGINSNTVLKFFAVDSTVNKEDIKTETYTILTVPKHTYYIDASASPGGDGSFTKPFQTIQQGIDIAQPGDTLIIRDGTYSYASEIYTVRSGNAIDGPITIKAEHQGSALLTRKGRIINIQHSYITLDGLVFDGQFSQTNGIVRVKTEAHNLFLKDIVARNNQAHIINMTSPENVTIDSSLIHTALNFYIDSNEQLKRAETDAHGISTEGVKNLVIENTEIRDVSGDSLQPEYGGWDNILLYNVHFWNRPVPLEIAQELANANSDQRFLQLEGKNPGENAIDTKQDATTLRGRITIKNSLFYGWKGDFIDNAAALNLKHNIEAEVIGNILFDNEIAMRLRGPGSYPGAWVTAYNNVLYNNLKAVRYEDQIENLHLYNNTFGRDNSQFFESAGGAGVDFQVLNNLFAAASKPQEANDPSNLAVAGDDTNFVDPNSHNYHLKETSSAIDKGIAIAEVTQDKDSIARPQGSAYDVGAYEYAGSIPNLTLTKSALVNGQPAAEATSGDIITYTINYQNSGQADAVKVIITDPIPQGTSYEPGSAEFVSGPTGAIDDTTATIKWTILAVPAGQSGSVSFEVRVE